MIRVGDRLIASPVDLVFERYWMKCEKYLLVCLLT